MRESCFGSGTQGKQDCYEYHQGRTEVNMRQKKRDGIWGYIFIAPQVIGLLRLFVFSILAFVNGMQFQSRFLLEFRIILQNFMTRHFIKLL